MTLNEAASLVTQKTKRRVIGFWKDGGEYIFNTQATDLLEPAQFVVRNGKVIPTNPLLSPVMIDRPMQKMNKPR